MEVKLPAGKYVVAVSGGVDSMVLLALLEKQAKSLKQKAKSKKISSFEPLAFGFELIVAHFNHGIRPDSDEDEELVAKTAQQYGLVFESARGNLGLETSEEAARRARYQFLENVKKKHKAQAIITAHHQDDALETAIINILRGTRRRGLSSMARSEIKRPLLNFSKGEIVKYAKQQGLLWREDSTNQDPKYLRNYLRLRVMPNLRAEQKRELIKNLDKVAKINNVLNKQIAILSQQLLKNSRIERAEFTVLPPEVARELMVYWLREIGIFQVDQKLIDRLVTVIKTAKPGTSHEINGQIKLKISTSSAYFESRR